MSDELTAVGAHDDAELEPCPTCKGQGLRKKRSPKEPGKPRRTLGINIPKHHQEDGAQVLEDLIHAVAPDDARSTYYKLVDGLTELHQLRGAFQGFAGQIASARSVLGAQDASADEVVAAVFDEWLQSRRRAA